MAEPFLSVGQAGTLVVAGVVTTLYPEPIVAGICGGAWSLSLMSMKEPGQEITWRTLASAANHLILSAFIAAWSAPLMASWLCDKGWIPEDTERLARGPIAVVIGLLAMPVIGRALMRLAERKLDQAGGTQ